jgi:hypothetical protein
VRNSLKYSNGRTIEYKLYNVSVDPEALKRAREEYKADKVPVVVEDGTVKNIGFGGGG